MRVLMWRKHKERQKGGKSFKSFWVTLKMHNWRLRLLPKNKEEEDTYKHHDSKYALYDFINCVWTDHDIDPHKALH